MGGITHAVGIRQETDVIKDINNGSWFATEHAWKYYINYVANPIKEHITNNNLTSTIRYIVLCKGVPFKIQPGGDFGSLICGVTVDGLLCMLNTNNYENFLHSLYTSMRSSAISDSQYYYSSTRKITNPYYSLSNPYGIDQNYTFNYRFKPDHFTTSWSGYTVKLSYLVSHLDGISYDVVEGIIDRSIAPDMSGSASWVLYDDPTMSGSNGYSVYNETKGRLSALGFNVISDTTNQWITSYSGGNVMGYTSWGTHAEDGNCSWEDSAWVVDSLNFNLSNGAVFNTLESFNGNSISTHAWRYIVNSPQYGCNHTQSLATQFSEIGGTGTMGHSSEPTLDGAVECQKFFPAYAMGYGMVDAIYQGMRNLAWQNVVVGDPLTTIAWGKQELSQDISMSKTNLITGVITVPLNNTITLDSNTVLRFKHNGFITGDGSILTDGKYFELQVEDWDRSLFRSEENNHPKIIWGEYPYASPNVEGYNIYRNLNNGGYTLIDSTDTETFDYIDEDVKINVPTGEDPKNVTYYVTATIYVGPGSEESDPSNTIDYWVDKARKIQSDNKVNLTNYKLEQNYPNPFNPSTQIKYSIKEAGLVQLRVYDILGKEVANLVNENKEAGYYSVDFDASHLSSGIYIYQLQSNNFISSKKMILIK